MKANNNFKLREIAGEFILIPVGEAAAKLQGMITLSESGALLWKKLQEECSEEDLTEAILEEYDTSREQAAADVKKFIQLMQENNLIA